MILRCFERLTLIKRTPTDPRRQAPAAAAPVAVAPAKVAVAVGAGSPEPLSLWKAKGFGWCDKGTTRAGWFVVGWFSFTRNSHSFLVEQMQDLLEQRTSTFLDALPIDVSHDADVAVIALN